MGHIQPYSENLPCLEEWDLNDDEALAKAMATCFSELTNPGFVPSMPLCLAFVTQAKREAAEQGYSLLFGVEL